MTWSAARYLLFEAERTRPVRDLLAAVAPGAPIRTAIDLGCGPGNSTEVLVARFPQAAVTGLDSSPDMIEAARRRLPLVGFALADIAQWRDPGPFDLVLSNAALQWVPDHQTLFPRLAACLAEGGTLAVQIPDNLDEPSQRLMLDVAADGPWAARLAGAAAQRTPIQPAAWYYDLLRAHCAAVTVWRTTYYQVLADGADGVVAFYESTGLRPFLQALDGAERDAFLRRYRTAIAGALPVQADGAVLLAMPRLFIVATR